MIEELWIYPVKSCRGIRLQKMQVDSFGPLYDREWVIVDESYRFLTQREIPELAQILTEISETHLVLKLGMREVKIPFKTSQERETQQVQVWKNALWAMDEGKEASAALSEFLGREVKLFRFQREPQRSVGLDIKAQTRFTDQFPFHVIHRSLVDGLQYKVPQQEITAESFRANIILKGPLVDEEELLNLKLNDFDLREGSPTSRCVITTLDPHSGEKRGTEPLALLAKTRRKLNKVYFGMHYVHTGTGVLHEAEVVHQGS
jgi:uncharacterized protein